MNINFGEKVEYKTDEQSKCKGRLIDTIEVDGKSIAIIEPTRTQRQRNEEPFISIELEKVTKLDSKVKSNVVYR